MRAYHDEEWGVPQRDARMLWEMLMLEGFQAGLAWIIVLRKREAFRKAFAGFDPKKVALGLAAIERTAAQRLDKRRLIAFDAHLEHASGWAFQRGDRPE